MQAAVAVGHAIWILMFEDKQLTRIISFGGEYIVTGTIPPGIGVPQSQDPRSSRIVRIHKIVPRMAWDSLGSAGIKSPYAECTLVLVFFVSTTRKALKILTSVTRCTLL